MYGIRGPRATTPLRRTERASKIANILRESEVPTPNTGGTVLDGPKYAWDNSRLYPNVADASVYGAMQSLLQTQFDDFADRILCKIGTLERQSQAVDAKVEQRLTSITDLGTSNSRLTEYFGTLSHRIEELDEKLWNRGNTPEEEGMKVKIASLDKALSALDHTVRVQNMETTEKAKRLKDRVKRLEEDQVRINEERCVSPREPPPPVSATEDVRNAVSERCNAMEATVATWRGEFDRLIARVDAVAMESEDINVIDWESPLKELREMNAKLAVRTEELDRRTDVHATRIDDVKRASVEALRTELSTTAEQWNTTLRNEVEALQKRFELIEQDPENGLLHRINDLDRRFSSLQDSERRALRSLEASSDLQSRLSSELHVEKAANAATFQSIRDNIAALERSGSGAPVEKLGSLRQAVSAVEQSAARLDAELKGTVAQWADCNAKVSQVEREVSLLRKSVGDGPPAWEAVCSAASQKLESLLIDNERALREEITAVKGELGNLVTGEQLQELQEDLHAQRDLTQLSGGNDSLEQDIASVKDTLRATAERAAIFESEQKEALSSVKERIAVMEELKETLHSNSGLASSLEVEQKEAFDALDARIGDIESLRETLQKSAEDVRQLESEQKEAFAGLNAKFADMDGLRKKLDGTTEHVANFESEQNEAVAAVKARIVELEGLRETLREAAERAASFESEQKEALAAVNERLVDMEGLRETLQSNGERANSLESQQKESFVAVNARIAELEGVRETLEECTQRAASFEVEQKEALAAMNARIADMETMKDTLRGSTERDSGVDSEQQDSSAAVSARIAEVSSRIAEVEQLRDTLEESTERATTFESEQKEAFAAVNVRIAEVEGLQKTLQENVERAATFETEQTEAFSAVNARITEMEGLRETLQENVDRAASFESEQKEAFAAVNARISDVESGMAEKMGKVIESVEEGHGAIAAAMQTAETNLAALRDAPRTDEAISAEVGAIRERIETLEATDVAAMRTELTAVQRSLETVEGSKDTLIALRERIDAHDDALADMKTTQVKDAPEPGGDLAERVLECEELLSALQGLVELQATETKPSDDGASASIAALTQRVEKLDASDRERLELTEALTEKVDALAGVVEGFRESPEDAKKIEKVRAELAEQGASVATIQSALATIREQVRALEKDFSSQALTFASRFESLQGATANAKKGVSSLSLRLNDIEAETAECPKPDALRQTEETVARMQSRVSELEVQMSPKGEIGSRIANLEQEQSRPSSPSRARISLGSMSDSDVVESGIDVDGPIKDHDLLVNAECTQGGRDSPQRDMSPSSLMRVKSGGEKGILGQSPKDGSKQSKRRKRAELSLEGSSSPVGDDMLSEDCRPHNAGISPRGIGTLKKLAKLPASPSLSPLPSPPCLQQARVPPDDEGERKVNAGKDETGAVDCIAAGDKDEDRGETREAEEKGETNVEEDKEDKTVANKDQEETTADPPSEKKEAPRIENKIPQSSLGSLPPLGVSKRDSLPSLVVSKKTSESVGGKSGGDDYADDFDADSSVNLSICEEIDESIEMDASSGQGSDYFVQHAEKADDGDE